MTEVPRPSSADYALIHAVGWLACNVMSSDPWRGIMIEVIAEAMPAANSAIPMVRDFAAHGAEILAARGDDRAMARATSAARDVTQKFHQIRAAEALEVFRKGKRNA
ncbi:hypothetical protein [Paenirhodobacter sp. CAU 1674]|uniref:hypothetical protein n=1 Tax=Paenirhodobacter sp. CAU 1674 TaxID=3032596 RepID=UPI0023D9C7C5|nr:hypothetical protein [Paenirhodobacter sp. CAU 1674]MDF2143225.1 hypothetical protein [Paenirhodobacter sp. CAU 1674]